MFIILSLDVNCRIVKMVGLPKTRDMSLLRWSVDVNHIRKLTIRIILIGQFAKKLFYKVPKDGAAVND